MKYAIVLILAGLISSCISSEKKESAREPQQVIGEVGRMKSMTDTMPACPNTLSQWCCNSIEKIVASRIDVINLYKQGILTESQYISHQRMQDSSAQISALTCAGLKVIDMQNSLRGILGLTSQARADRKAKKIEQDALDYYSSLIQQN